MIRPSLTRLPSSSAWMRRGAACALVGQFLTGTPPVFAETLTRAVGTAGARAWTDLARQVRNASVRVNRTPPDVAPPANLEVAFGDAPTTEAIASARIFPERLVPTAEPTPEQNLQMARLLEAFARTGPERGLVLLQDAIREWVASPWRAALLSNGASIFKAAG